MNNQELNTKDYLRRWIEGDVTRQEESQLDREAGQDAFLQEAMEGYRSFPEGDHQERLTRMRSRLPARKDKKRVVLISLPYRIAAAAAVVLAVGLFWLLQPDPSAGLADAAGSEQAATAELSESRADETAPPVAEANESGPIAFSAPQDEETDRDDASSPPVVPGEATTAKPSPDLKKTNGKDTSTEALAEAATGKARAGRVLESEPTPIDPLNSKVVTREEAAYPAGAPARAAQGAPAAVENFTLNNPGLNQAAGAKLVTGQVLDRSGTPLNGVLVVSPGDRTAGAITNLNGQYQIYLDSNVQKLDFERTGYSSQRVNVPDGGGYVKVTLDENAATVDQMLAEKEASRKRKKDKFNPSVSGVTANGNIAQPVVGYKRFENYLNLNVRYPQQALDKEITGEVILSFTIEPDGKLTNIRAQGPGYGLEEEAIRLLKGGAPWKITNSGGQSIHFIYRMKFAL